MRIGTTGLIACATGLRSPVWWGEERARKQRQPIILVGEAQILRGVLEIGGFAAAGRGKRIAQRRQPIEIGGFAHAAIGSADEAIGIGALHGQAQAHSVLHQWPARRQRQFVGVEAAIGGARLPAPGIERGVFRC